MNKPRLIHGIDLYAPGGLEALFAYRRAQFGDAVMQLGAGDAGDSGAGDQQGAEGGTGGDQAAAGAGAQQDGEKPAGDQQAEWDGKVESLPAAAQKIIADLREEAGDERVAGKTLSAIQKALNPDAKGDEKPDADQLAKALAERDTETRQAKTELAVYRLAGKHSADADALLDSRAFLAKIADLDPSKTADIEKAIKEAVN
ncbi:hypothetical protein, partial [Thermocatellispora tengchongensis]|uniref:hypothetical protein n=1 Tax=Thermocatellispora tengchongensis TaxID=1073253 RepID=UPI0031EBEB82